MDPDGGISAVWAPMSGRACPEAIEVYTTMLGHTTPSFHRALHSKPHHRSGTIRINSFLRREPSPGTSLRIPAVAGYTWVQKSRGSGAACALGAAAGGGWMGDGGIQRAADLIDQPRIGRRGTRDRGTCGPRRAHVGAATCWGCRAHAAKRAARRPRTSGWPMDWEYLRTLHRGGFRRTPMTNHQDTNMNTAVLHWW